MHKITWLILGSLLTLKAPAQDTSLKTYVKGWHTSLATGVQFLGGQPQNDPLSDVLTVLPQASLTLQGEVSFFPNARWGLFFLYRGNIGRKYRPEVFQEAVQAAYPGRYVTTTQAYFGKENAFLSQGLLGLRLNFTRRNIHWQPFLGFGLSDFPLHHNGANIKTPDSHALSTIVATNITDHSFIEAFTAAAGCRLLIPLTTLWSFQAGLDVFVVDPPTYSYTIRTTDQLTQESLQREVAYGRAFGGGVLQVGINFRWPNRFTQVKNSSRGSRGSRRFISNEMWIVLSADKKIVPADFR